MRGPSWSRAFCWETPAKSYHAKHRVTENDIFDNRLIFGDNLLALKALEAEFAGKVKCVFIDPPYTTGSAFTEKNVRASIPCRHCSFARRVQA